MGGGYPTVNESTSEMLQAMERYFAPAMQSINTMATPTAVSQAQAGAAALPISNAAQLQSLQDYGPLLQEVGRDLMNKDTLGAVEGELAIAQGPGRQLASEARTLQEQVDPEYFALRKQIPGLTDKWLAAVGEPGQLSDTEREEMSRGLGQRGFTNPGSAIDTAENAQLFGQASRARAMDFGNVIAQTANMLNPLAMSGIEVATRRPLQSNMGTNQLQQANQEGGNQAYSFGNNMWSGMQGYQNQYLAKSKDTLDQIQQGTKIAGDMIGSVAGGVMGGI